MKVKLNKRTKRLILILSVLLVALIALSVALYFANAERRQTAKGRTVEIDTKEDGVLNLGGFGVFFDKYSGQFKSSEIADKMGNVVTLYLPTVKDQIDDLTEAELSDYYTKNASNLKRYFGVMTFEEFKPIATMLNGTTIDLDTHYRLDVIKESFTNKTEKMGYAYAEFKISYKSEETLTFGAYISKSYTNDPEYLIVSVEN